MALIRVTQQDINGSGAPVPAGGGAEGEDFRAQAQPIIHLALQNRLPLLGAVSLPMDDLGAAYPAPGAGRQKLVTELFGEGCGQAMQIQFQFPGDGPPLEIVQDPLLNAGFGVEKEFMGLDLCLGQAKWLVILCQVFGLFNGIGRGPPAPGFRQLKDKRSRVFHLGAEELAFIKIRGSAHDGSEAHTSCQ